MMVFYLAYTSESVDRRVEKAGYPTGLAAQMRQQRAVEAQRATVARTAHAARAAERPHRRRCAGTARVGWVDMDYRTLGNSGCSVSNLCLGTMTFGAEADEAVSHAQLDTFAEAGGNFIDSADVYAAGSSEEIIGRWFATRPPELTEPMVLATKGRFPLDDSPNGAGLSARHLTRALDNSLFRLGLDSVDLYQLHAFDAWTPMEETLRTMDGFVRSGKIRYWGLSNFTGWQLTKVVYLARALGLVAPVTLQPQYSLLVREIEWEIVPAALDTGLGLLPWSPLGGGWLSGKYRRDQRPSGDTRLGDDPEPRHGGLGPARHRTHLEHRRRGAEGRRRPRDVHGRGRARVGDRPSGRHLDHPRRTHRRAARDEPQGRRPAPQCR